MPTKIRAAKIRAAKIRVRRPALIEDSFNSDNISNLKDPLRGITINPEAYSEEITSTKEFSQLTSTLKKLIQEQNSDISEKLRHAKQPIILTYIGRKLNPETGDDIFIFQQESGSQLEINAVEWIALQPKMEAFRELIEKSKKPILIYDIQKLQNETTKPTNSKGVFVFSTIFSCLSLATAGFGIWASLTHAAIGSVSLQILSLSATVLTGIVWPLAIATGLITLGSALYGLKQSGGFNRSNRIFSYTNTQSAIISNPIAGPSTPT